MPTKDTHGTAEPFRRPLNESLLTCLSVPPPPFPSSLCSQIPYSRVSLKVSEIEGTAQFERRFHFTYWLVNIFWRKEGVVIECTPQTTSHREVQPRAPAAALRNPSSCWSRSHALHRLLQPVTEHGGLLRQVGS